MTNPRTISFHFNSLSRCFVVRFSSAMQQNPPSTSPVFSPLAVCIARGFGTNAKWVELVCSFQEEYKQTRSRAAKKVIIEECCDAWLRMGGAFYHQSEHDLYVKVDNLVSCWDIVAHYLRRPIRRINKRNRRAKVASPRSDSQPATTRNTDDSSNNVQATRKSNLTSSNKNSEHLLEAISKKERNDHPRLQTSNLQLLATVGTQRHWETPKTTNASRINQSSEDGLLDTIDRFRRRLTGTKKKI